MPTIVQQGAVSPPEEGGLFQDVSFWVSSRVPARAAIVSDIKVRRYFRSPSLRMLIISRQMAAASSSARNMPISALSTT